MPRTKTQDLLKLLWHTTLSDYVTAIAAGGSRGELLVWTETTKGKGFG